MVHRVTQDCCWHSCQFTFLLATLHPMGIYFWSTADSFNLHNIPKSNMQNTSHIKPFKEIISQLFSSDILYPSVIMYCAPCVSVGTGEWDMYKKQGVLYESPFMPSCLTCAAVKKCPEPEQQCDFSVLSLVLWSRWNRGTRWTALRSSLTPHPTSWFSWTSCSPEQWCLARCDPPCTPSLIYSAASLHHCPTAASHPSTATHWLSDLIMTVFDIS